MTSSMFRMRSKIASSADEVFTWHSRAGAFERLAPPWQRARVVERIGSIRDGDRTTLELGVGPFRARWVAEHRGFIPGREFRDIQLAGPFAAWEHTHRVEADGAGSCWLEDRVEYRLPFGRIGNRIAGRWVRSELERTFAYRHRVTAHDLGAHDGRKETTMKILITGASGLIGSKLVPFLTSSGNEVVRLVRSRQAGAGTVFWDPARGEIDSRALEGVDAVVHLAGESIASGRWNATRKARIRSSRVDGTRLLADAIAHSERKPKVLVSGSAIGFYGNRGEEALNEESASGNDFLAEVCREWEAKTRAASDAGVRVALLRTGIVLSPEGGALGKMLLPFKLGVGGQIGDGRQYMSWIAIDDILGAIHHALVNEHVRGPLNGVAPNPVTNHTFTKTLGRVLSRPTLLPMPAFAARLALGEMADALLLGSQRVSPGRLLATGYNFRFTELEPALRHVLGK